MVETIANICTKNMNEMIYEKMVSKLKSGSKNFTLLKVKMTRANKNSPS